MWTLPLLFDSLNKFWQVWFFTGDLYLFTCSHEFDFPADLCLVWLKTAKLTFQMEMRACVNSTPLNRKAVSWFVRPGFRGWICKSSTPHSMSCLDTSAVGQLEASYLLPGAGGAAMGTTSSFWLSFPLFPCLPCSHEWPRFLVQDVLFSLRMNKSVKLSFRNQKHWRKCHLDMKFG